jgi:hypothetical protein
MQTSDEKSLAEQPANEELTDPWFAEPHSTMRPPAADRRRSSAPPPLPPDIDDELADRWFR